MIQAQFGQKGIALRTLEVYTTSTMRYNIIRFQHPLNIGNISNLYLYVILYIIHNRATLFPPNSPAPEWRELMDSMSKDASTVYRDLVYRHPKFVEYFRMTTPEPEFAHLNIGSRVSQIDNLFRNTIYHCWKEALSLRVV